MFSNIVILVVKLEKEGIDCSYYSIGNDTYIYRYKARILESYNIGLMSLMDIHIIGS